jgi:hypothetical protein
MNVFEERAIARIIGNFYLDKNKGDYKKTHEEIFSLQITQIKLNDNTISITLSRPGLIIGRRGENLDMLQRYLTQQLKFYHKIEIVEDKILSYLYPCEPYDIFDED